jgi:hypothetical protein
MNGTEPTDWDHLRALVSEPTIQCLQSSARASLIRHYQVNLVPAMCQTADYTRALMAGTFRRTGSQVEGYLDMRRRYRQLMDRDGSDIRVLLDEAVVRRQIGSRDVMREQTLDLIQLDGAGRLSLGLVPFSAGAHVGLRGSFVHLHASDGSQRDLVYREVDGLDAIEIGGPATRYAEDFDRLWGDALQGDGLRHHLAGLW